MMARQRGDQVEPIIAGECVLMWVVTVAAFIAFVLMIWGATAAYDAITRLF